MPEPLTRVHVNRAHTDISILNQQPNFEVGMLSFIKTQSARRSGPNCLCCGLRMMVARITPHPDQEPGAVLCTYECVCGEKTDRKES
jgi:hypothetical protein